MNDQMRFTHDRIGFRKVRRISLMVFIFVLSSLTFLMMLGIMTQPVLSAETDTPAAKPPPPEELHSIELALSANPQVILSGSLVTYTYVVTNVDDETLVDIDLTDDYLGQVTSPFTLANQVSSTFVLTAVIVADRTSTAMVTGTITGTTDLVTATAAVFVDVITPGLQLQYTVVPTTVFQGEPVTYTYLVTNSGDVTLTDILVTDNQLGSVAGPFTLTAWANTSFTMIATPTANVTSSATVTGTHPLGDITATGQTSVAVHTRVFLPVVLKNWPTWQQIGDKPAGVDKFYAVAVCDDRHLAVADTGIFVLNGNNWQQKLATTGPTLGVTFVDTSCDRAYAVTFGNGVWYGTFTTDWAWSRVDAGDSSDDSSWAVAVRGSTVFIGGEYGIRWSTIPIPPSQAHSWQTTNINKRTTGLTIQPGSDTIFASVWNDGVYTNNVGAGNSSWTKQGTIGDPLVYEAIGNSSGTPSLAGTQTGAYRWTGSNWAATAAAYPNTTFAVATNGIQLFAGQRNAGVLASQDGGLTWSTINTGLSMPGGVEFQVRGFFVTADGKYLYAATTSGVWRWPLQ